MNRLAIAALLGCVAPVATGHAQELPAPPSAPPAAAGSATTAPAKPQTDEGRYTYYRVQDTFVRLDLRTGHVATCARGIGGWTCQAAPDERTALEAEISRLQSENATLKAELLKRGLALPEGLRPAPERPMADAKPQPKGPGKEEDKERDKAQSTGPSEIERVTTFLGSIWQRLVEIVADLQRDIQREL